MASSRRSADAAGGTRSDARLRGLLLGTALTAAIATSAVALREPLPDVIAAAETAACTAVGRIEEAAAVDLHGHAAWLVVEQVVSGKAEASERIRIGWEELARGRAPRFENGDRVLVALDRLPKASLWYQRFAADLRRGRVLAVAAEGTAYLHDPDAQSVALLQAYLAQPTTENSEPRLIAIAEIATAPAVRLAVAALDRLAALLSAEAPLPQVVSATLAKVLADAAGPVPVRARIAELAGERRWASLRASLEVAAVPGDASEVQAIAALAAIDGGMPQDRVATLLQRDEAEVRAVAVAHITAPELLTDLPRRLREDPAAAVRAAAATTLVQRQGLAAFAAVRPALADSAPEVRIALAAALGALGDPVIAPLEQIFTSGTFEEARGDVLALEHVGLAGRAAIRRLAAASAADERRRNLAEIALGHLDTHDH